MKKKLGALFAALVLGGAVFAENYTKGIDLQLGGSIGTTKMKSELDEISGVSVEWTQNIFEGGGHFKIASYDCFLLNDMLGIYAGLGVNWGAFKTDSDFSVKIGGTSTTIGSGDSEVNEHGFALSLEFMVGPAFGVDLGGVRFQMGLGFHGVFAWGWFFGRTDYDDYGSSGRERGKVHYNAFGLAVTPQFRFGASKRCSFLLGCDLTFDFPNKLSYEAGKYKMEVEFDKGFRFGAIPYIGLGINF